ncbi:MAG: hypothetical protein J6D02_02110 [Lachnospira sp.]|nr:hypothetical protein [Lachnospira sp.]
MEKLEELFGCYDLPVKRVFRGRKMLMCETMDKGLYGITATKASVHRLEREYLVKDYLNRQGFTALDQLCRNREGSFITEDKYHTSYVVKHFFVGKELSIDSLEEVEEGAYNLALLHNKAEGMLLWLKEEEERIKKQLRQKIEEEQEETARQVMEQKFSRIHYFETEDGIKEQEGVNAYEWMKQRFLKKNRELKRIGEYMKKNGNKGSFGEQYNRYSSMFIKEGQKAFLELEQRMKDQQELKRLKYGFCHGNYQHHNVLKTEEGWATIGMEQFHFAPQILDLYDYLRKVLEKNHYTPSYAHAIISGYGRVICLTKTDCETLFLLLQYPEKFWKISNHYYNSKKTWVPPKTVEKLSKVVEQDQEKARFLVKFREDFVD